MAQVKINPGYLMEMSGSFWKTCTLHAGVKLDVFTVIGRKKMSADSVANLTDSDEDGMTRLLDALSSMQLLKKEDDLYSNVSGGFDFLSKDSPGYIGYMIMHHQDILSHWGHLDEAVKSGKNVREEPGWKDERKRENFLMGMFNIASAVAPGAADAFDLSNETRLLDLGGGPGTYAIHFCRKNPQLNAVVYDLPGTKPFAEKTIERFSMSDRIKFVEGNFVTDDIEGTYDAAWLSHILHSSKLTQCIEIIRKAVSVLKPGGIIGIHEFILKNQMDGPEFCALFSLNMLVGTESGRAYSEKQIMSMLDECGVKNIERIDFSGVNDSGIICGRT